MLSVMTVVGLLLAGILGEGETVYPKWICLTPEPIIAALKVVNEEKSYSSPAASLAYTSLMQHPDCTSLPGPIPMIVSKRIWAYTDFENDQLVVVEMVAPSGAKAYSWVLDQGTSSKG